MDPRLRDRLRRIAAENKNHIIRGGSGRYCGGSGADVGGSGARMGGSFGSRLTERWNKGIDRYKSLGKGFEGDGFYGDGFKRRKSMVDDDDDVGGYLHYDPRIEGYRERKSKKYGYGDIPGANRDWLRVMGIRQSSQNPWQGYYKHKPVSEYNLFVKKWMEEHRPAEGYGSQEAVRITMAAAGAAWRARPEWVDPRYKAYMKSMTGGDRSFNVMTGEYEPMPPSTYTGPWPRARIPTEAAHGFIPPPLIPPTGTSADQSAMMMSGMSSNPTYGSHFYYPQRRLNFGAPHPYFDSYDASAYYMPEYSPMRTRRGTRYNNYY